MTDRTAADDAYANGAHIPNGEGYYARWEAEAAAFRDGHKLKELDVSYGPKVRQVYDMYHPARAAKGTVIFVHGGYWLAGAPLMFSHLGRGAVEAGYACATPSYTLAPDAKVAEMTVEVAAACAAIAKRTEGPIYLAGHSAGGHLVARMGCADMAADWSARVARIMAISPLSDLEPLRGTTMNDTLGIDAAEALAESPIRHSPQDIPVTVWVGSDERPVFLDQAAWLHAAWGCDMTVDAGRHHFDVIEGLEDPTSAMMRVLLS